MLSFGWTAPCWKGCWIICWATVSGTIRSLFKSGCKPTFPAAFSASWFRMTARVIRPTCSPRCMRRSPCPTPRTFSACMSWNRLPPRTAEALSSHRTRSTAQKPLCGFRWQGKTQVSDSIKNAPDSSKSCRGTVVGIKKNHLFRDDFQPGDSLRLGLTGPTGLFLAARRRFGQAALTARRAVIHYRLFSPYRPPKAKKIISFEMTSSRATNSGLAWWGR